MTSETPRSQEPFFQTVTDATAWTAQERIKAATAQLAEYSDMQSLVSRAASRQFASMSETRAERSRATFDALTAVAADITERARSQSIIQDFADYLRDSAERALLFTDVLRERGDIFVSHEAAGCPPVLSYDYEVILDGADLPHPTNYVLLRILPPEGVTIDENARPYIIIDPRAGHGAGIGGFKSDSQVGVALKAGSPVYFVNFKRDPVPTQTLADVTRSEATFVREVMRRHPNSAKPVVAGNCQGGWATLVLGAANPDLTGPLLINGAPVDAWAGEVGRNPMRYNGGMLGGKWLAMLAADLGHGIFDGAQLVENFEKLNPSRNYFGKYYDLYANVDTERERFLEFERWWGGYFLMNEAEITWIVENIFIGNKLARNEASLEPGRHLDLKAIRAPIIIFTSHGDNITPPQQALNWVRDTYANVDEIRIRGQRIIYMVHPSVGHLGIFVSGSVAKKEHTEVASTLQMVEALAPGLYEMIIESEIGEGLDKQFVVSFAERTLDDIDQIDDGHGDETPFAAVSRLSEVQAEAYDILLRPTVQAMTTRESAQFLRETNSLRLQRKMMSSSNPAMRLVESSAAAVRESRNPAAADNPFVRAENLWSEAIQQSLDMMRDMRDAWYEISFFSLYSTPAMRWFGRRNTAPRTLKSIEELRGLPEVQQALLHVDTGGFVEAVIRMLILLADSRGAVRRDRLDRSSRVLSQDEPFASLSPDRRAQIIHQQTLIVEFAREEAITSLPKLLRTPEERQKAGQVIVFVPGAISDMSTGTLTMVRRIHQVLGLPEVTADVSEDPLNSASVRAAE